MAACSPSKFRADGSSVTNENKGRESQVPFQSVLNCAESVRFGMTCCSGYCAAEEQFGSKRAERDLRRYRRLCILPRSLATSREEGGGCDPGRAPLGFAKPLKEPVKPTGEQGQGESENGAGRLEAFADSDHARPLHRRRPRRDDRGSGKVSRCRGIRIWERSVKAVDGIWGRSFRCHVW